MQTPRFIPPMAVLLFGITSLVAQDSPPRDVRAVALLQQSVIAMGGSVPADFVATGGVTLVAGSKTETGTVRILTRGLDQSAESIQTSDASRAVTYSRGQAQETDGTSVKSLQMELVVTSQCPDFPLPLLAGALNSLDTAIRYIGSENLEGSTVHHVRVWNTFASESLLRALAEFSARDIWIDAKSGLPRKLSYLRRAAQGAEPGIPMEVFYSDYRNVSGVLYPFHIEKSFNGTAWATITIQSVTTNNGLTDADFPVR